MKKIRWMLMLLFISSSFLAGAQVSPVDSIRFFTDEGLIEITLTTDFKQIQSSKGEDDYHEATVKCIFPDNSVIVEKVRVAARGNFRRKYCNIPPLMLHFRNATSPLLSPLGKLKLVIGCGNNTADEQLLLKEYLTYKMFNMLEEKSFRVRLVRINYMDVSNKVKPFTQFAFFIEDDNDMAERNGCEKRDKAQFYTESTDREQMTKVALFQYMISNGDWGVPSNHNIKLIYVKNEQQLPFVVPYDFDHSGFVNADYALPPELFVERFGVEKVTDRVYRGYPRTMEELLKTIGIFNSKRNDFTALINNFQHLSSRTKKNAVEFINQFYSIINNNRDVQSIFIKDARNN